MAALSEMLAQALAGDDADLVVDLSAVEYLGAPTIGILLRAAEVLRLRSRSLTLRSPSATALHVLDVCDLSHLIAPER